MFFAQFIVAQEKEEKPFRKMLWETPADLDNQTLLVAMYENKILDEGEQSLYKTDRQFRAQVERFNGLVKEQNQNISKELEKSYKGKYMLVKLKEVDSLSKKGYKYFLDLIVMPKQFNEPEQKALIASYKVHETGSTMFNNYDAQFNYYFYLRDIQTNDVYLSKQFKGNFFLYDAMSDFLKRVRKELKK